jgi:hypothetical protein
MFMSAIARAAFPIGHMLFRSLLPRNQQIRVPDSGRRRRQRHELAAMRLAKHFAMTSLLFLVLVVAVWLASLIFHSLHSMYAFPGDLVQFLDRLELWLAYVDGALICGTLFIGSCCYVLDMFRGIS